MQHYGGAEKLIACVVPSCHRMVTMNACFLPITQHARFLIFGHMYIVTSFFLMHPFRDHLRAAYKFPRF